MKLPLLKLPLPQIVRRLLPLVTAALLAPTLPSSAELVVMHHGRVMKVDAFQLLDDGSRFEFTLPSGGAVTLPVTAVERIVDDEIVPEPPPEPEVTRPNLDFLAHLPVPETPYGQLIHATAQRHGLNADLVAAVVAAESAFDPRAVSVKGARGLMQLMPATAERFGVRTHELFDPRRNLEAGVTYLAWLRKRFDDDLPRILAGYNAGEGAVDRHGGIPPYRETRNYVRRVLDRFEGGAR